MTIKCCVCTKIRIDNQWLRPDAETGSNELISHSYCPACLEDALAELETQGAMATTPCFSLPYNHTVRP